jgi:hypothetical protein
MRRLRAKITGVAGGPGPYGNQKRGKNKKKKKDKITDRQEATNRATTDNPTGLRPIPPIPGGVGRARRGLRYERNGQCGVDETRETLRVSDKRDRNNELTKHVYSDLQPRAYFPFPLGMR